MINALKVMKEVNTKVVTAGFESGSALLSTPETISSAKYILSSLPRDSVLLAFGREARGARAFLSSSMVVNYPVNVLSDGEGEGEVDPTHILKKSLLILSSKMVLTSISLLLTSVLTPCRSPLFSALSYLTFSRRFQAAALTAWREVDSERLAASIINPYSQAYAMKIAAERMNDGDTENAANVQLKKMREAMKGLLGNVKAKEVLDEVEVAVRVTMEDAFEREEEEKVKRGERREVLLEEQREKEKEREQEVRLELRAHCLYLFNSSLRVLGRPNYRRSRASS